MLLQKSLTLSNFTLLPVIFLLLSLSSLSLLPPYVDTLSATCSGAGGTEEGQGQGLAQIPISLAVSDGKMDPLFQYELAREIDLEREGGRRESDIQ